MEISSILQRWYSQNLRDLPWRQTSDPYRIWLSEIILQQTRVVQGLAYYERFIKTFPSVNHLAAASTDEVLKLWQGLGYYSRARNLHKAAQQVVAGSWHDAAGKAVAFPTQYADLITLTGVGRYTAAAIASFSSGEAVAVVDGNVYRVLSRLFDIDTPIDTTTGQKTYAALAHELLDTQQAALHNQAIMEFGALQCTPTRPDCPQCPLIEKCMAYMHNTIEMRPVKAKKVKVRERHLHYYIIIEQQQVWVHQRKEGDIWQGLWEFYHEEEQPNAQLEALPAITSFDIKHQLTHQTLLCSFKVIQLNGSEFRLPVGYCKISWEEWQKKAVPKLISMANERISALF